MNLEKLGWNQDLAHQFAALGHREWKAGRVSIASRNFCQLLHGGGEEQVRVPGRLRHRALTPAELPAVGDWVAFKQGVPGREGTVEAVLPRRTRISRQTPGRQNNTPVEQVIAANIDTVLIVTGLDQDFNPRRLERYLALVHQGGAMPVILLNKTDLCTETAARVQEVKRLAVDTPVHPICARTDRLKEVLSDDLDHGQTLAVVGSSGVGKSTLINNLLGFSRQETRAVSGQVGKGRHTTTLRELILLADGGILIDNPGMRELQLFGEAEMLRETFPEIFSFSPDCRFNNCRHESEPGCAVKVALKKELLIPERYHSFIKLQNELLKHREKATLTSSELEKRRRGGGPKAIKRWRRDDWREEK